MEFDLSVVDTGPSNGEMVLFLICFVGIATAISSFAQRVFKRLLRARDVLWWALGAVLGVGAAHLDGPIVILWFTVLALCFVAAALFLFVSRTPWHQIGGAILVESTALAAVLSVLVSRAL